MGLGIIGSGIGYHEYMVDKGVREEVAGKNRGICSREINIQNLYSCIAGGGFQYVPKVVGPRTRPQIYREDGRVKYRTVYSVKN